MLQQMYFYCILGKSLALGKPPLRQLSVKICTPETPQTYMHLYKSPMTPTYTWPPRITWPTHDPHLHRHGLHYPHINSHKLRGPNYGMWGLYVHVSRPTLSRTQCNSHYLKVTIFLRLIFLRIGPKTQNFVLANISYTHRRTLEFVDPLPHLRTQIAKLILVHAKCALNQNRKKKCTCK